MSRADELYDRHRTLLAERELMRKELKRGHKIVAKYLSQIKAKNLEIKGVTDAIYSMKHGGETPSVSDHAIVRYLERYKDVDINLLKLEISQHSQAVKQDNLIVTVNHDISDRLEELSNG